MNAINHHFIKSIILPLADKAMKTNIAASYKLIKLLQKCSKDEIMQWQNEQLQKLVEHTCQHSPYYSNIFKLHGIAPERIKTFEDLNSAIRSDAVGTVPNKKSATGGSTGDPMKYLLDHRSWSFSNANNIINWEKTGYRYGDKYIALGSTSLFVNNKSSLKHRIYYRIKNKIGLNGVNMSDEVCSSYVSFIKSKKVKFIYGYASAIYLLAKYCVKTNLNLDIKACFPTSEVLTDLFRQTIEDAFRCTIVDCYGAHDGGITAFAHNKGFFEVGYSCMVTVEKPNSDGVGPALVTDLFNYAMPLINYKLGDEILIDEARNKYYGYNGQIINQVLGRTSDIMELENGNTLTGPGFTILFKDLPVEHYCIEKIGKNAIKCNIVKLNDYTTEHENIVRSTFSKQMGKNTEFSIEYTTEIPLSNSGKRRYFMP